MVAGQSNAEALSQSSAIPVTGQTTWWISFPALTWTTSGAGEVETDTPIHLTSTHWSSFLKQPSTSVGGTGLYTIGVNSTAFGRKLTLFSAIPLSRFSLKMYRFFWRISS